MECPICLNDWDSNTCVPLMLNCGHSFCRNCLSSIVIQQYNNQDEAKQNEKQVLVQCPNCELQMSLVKPVNDQRIEACLNLLIKNYALISLVEAQRNQNKKEDPEVKQPKYDKAKFQRDFEKGYIDSSGNKSDRKQLDEDQDEGDPNEQKQIGVLEAEDPDQAEVQILPLVIEEERVYPPAPVVPSGLKCLVHKNCLVHSYVVVKIKVSKLEKYQHTLLCTSCIYEKNLNVNQIDIIPSVMTEIKSKIKSTKILINYRKNQLQQSQQYFQRIQQGNRQIVQNKMKEHFQKLRNIMDEYEQKCEDNLSSLLKKQEEKIKVIQDGIALETDHLLNDELNLSSLESHDDTEIIYMTNIIDDQHRKLASEYRPNVNFKNISIAIQLSESVYSKLDTLLHSKCKLMLDDLRQDGEPIKFMDILERDKQWRCQGCDSNYNKDTIFCQECQQFRPLEMFKNLLHNPMKVSNFELNCIDQRRIKEKQLILDQDIKEDEEESELDKLWFILSGDWLFQWKCFISNKISNSSSVTAESKNKVRFSKNKEIGILPPGQISNAQLFITDENGEQGHVLKPGLQLNKDYRGVNYEVWTLLKKIYGGGPQEIVRETLDIYSEDVYEKYVMLESQRTFNAQEKQALKRSQTQKVNNEGAKNSSANALGKAPLARRQTNLNPRQQSDQQLLPPNTRSSSQSNSKNMLSLALFQKSGVAGVGRNKHKRNDSMDSRYVPKPEAPPTPVNLNKQNFGLSNKRNLFDNNPNVPKDRTNLMSPKVPQDSHIKNMISVQNANFKLDANNRDIGGPNPNSEQIQQPGNQALNQAAQSQPLAKHNSQPAAQNSNFKDSLLNIIGMGK